MGVTWVLRWKPNGPPSQEDERLLDVALQKFDVRQPRLNKKVEIKCNLLRQVVPSEAAMVGRGPARPEATMRDVWLIQHNDANETCYLLNRFEHLVVEADNSMLRIVEGKLGYKVKTVVQLQGKRYVKGDFQIKLSTATQTTTGAMGSTVFLGHVLEVEYSAVSHLDIAADIMQEFVDMLCAHIPQVAAAAPGTAAAAGAGTPALGPAGTPGPLLPTLAGSAPGGVQQQQQQHGLEAGAKSNAPVGSLEVIHTSYHKYPGLPSSFSHMHLAVLYTEMAIVMVTSNAAGGAGQTVGGAAGGGHV